MTAARATLCLAACVLLVGCSGGSGVAAEAKQDEPSYSPLQFFRNCLGIQGKDTGPARSGGIQVIGAGFSKTGTKSVQLALEMLGHKIYDFQAIMGEGHIPFLKSVVINNETGEPRGLYWDARDDDVRRQNFKAWHEEILNFGATATLDNPVNFFFEEFAELNPNAKVLLTTHHSGDKNQWIASFADTWLAFGPIAGWPFSFFLPDVVSWGDAIFPSVGCGVWRKWWRPIWAPWINLSYGNLTDFDTCAQGYDDFNQRVRDTIPADRLLEFNVRQGWDPLCRFFEIAEQDCPSSQGVEFPRVNSRDDMQIIAVIFHFLGYAWPLVAVVPLLVLALVYCFCKLCCCGSQKREHPAKGSKQS
eukprot:INCI628.2.p1 GENE.INCI628.2~~INCI628.2.p1  ORF type:complete len:389 (-),score=63.43 INCI628.2:411-1490(-)